MPHHDLSGLPDPTEDRQFYDGVPFKRLIAWGIDVGIVTLLVIGVFIFSFGIATLFFFAVIFLVNFGYRWFTLTQGSATLGMRAMGIEIRNGAGDPLSQSEALAHTACHIGTFFFPFLPLISAAMSLINIRGQGLHDWIVGTTAINRPA